MLVECSKCGAPLDVKQDERFARCNYCQATTRVGQTRTIAVMTPAQWAPPQVWTPPPQTGLPAQALTYHQTRKAVKRTVVLILVFSVLGVVVPILFCLAATFLGAANMSRPASRPTPAAGSTTGPTPAPTRWDGASPLVCGGNDRLVLEDVETPVGMTPDVLVRVTGGNCKLTFRRVKLRATTLVRAESSVEITFEDSSFVGNVFADVEHGAEIQLARSVVTVEQLVTRGTSTKLAIGGSTQVRASRVIAELGANAQVDIEGADVSLESDGEGIVAENNARMRLSGARIVARSGAALRTGDVARLELDSATLVGKLEGLRVGRSAQVQMRQGSVTAEGAAIRTGRSVRLGLEGTRVEGAVALDFEDHATADLSGATIVGERRTGRHATIRER